MPPALAEALHNNPIETLSGDSNQTHSIMNLTFNNNHQLISNN
jgi:hypothetical protein